jgi:hypothetical protein
MFDVKEGKEAIKMNKVFIYVVAIISVSISAQIGFAAPILIGSQAGPTISVEPSYLTVSQGENFTVNITIDPAGEKIRGATFELHFDNSLLNATSLCQGTFFSGFGTLSCGEGIKTALGKIDYAEIITDQEDEGITKPGTLVTVAFQAIGECGVSKLCFEEIILSDPLACKILNITVNNGTIDIAQPSTPFLIRGSVSYKDGSECNDPTVNITNLNTSDEWTAETNETSNYYQIVLSSGANITAGNTLQFNAISPDKSQWKVTEHTITQTEVGAGGFEYNIALEYRPGDVNGDGKITSADAVIALQMAVCGGYDRVADVNDDKSVTSLDALMIMQAAAEHITFGG